MDNEVLQSRITLTYNALRFGMVIISASMPIVVVAWGHIFGVDWQKSMSDYYFALPAGEPKLLTYPCRVPFVGMLFALGSFLYLYKGFSKRENIALNFAGLCALGVALCPEHIEPGYIPYSCVLHPAFAIFMFIGMAYTAIFCHDDTLQFITVEDRRRRYKIAYYIIGWFMGLFPLSGLVLAHYAGGERPAYWIEAAGTWAFAAYWYTKSRELEESQLETTEVAESVA